MVAIINLLSVIESLKLIHFGKSRGEWETRWCEKVSAAAKGKRLAARKRK